jgi:large subunit ribosomal protein L1
MKKRSKKYVEAKKKLDATKVYKLDEAIALLKQVSFAKFDETVDLSFRLGVDPRHADQMVRGAISLPAGTGKTVRVCVIASGEKVTEAQKAGADFAGGDDIIQKIAGGWMDFDRMIATPDMMGKIGRIGRLLGPRGLMPNPKLGTVTTDVAKAVTEQKAGKVEYRTEKTGIVQVPCGKKSFSVENLKQNLQTVIATIVKAKPTTSKGVYLRSITLSTTMSPGIALDTAEAMGI